MINFNVLFSEKLAALSKNDAGEDEGDAEEACGGEREAGDADEAEVVEDHCADELAEDGDDDHVSGADARQGDDGGAHDQRAAQAAEVDPPGRSDQAGEARTAHHPAKDEDQKRERADGEGNEGAHQRRIDGVLETRVDGGLKGNGGSGEGDEGKDPVTHGQLRFPNEHGVKRSVRESRSPASAHPGEREQISSAPAEDLQGEPEYCRSL